MDHSPEDINRIEVLFKTYQPAMCNVAYNIVADANAAKDIVQEVFLKLWERRADLEFGPAMKGYLFKATTHLSLNYLEKRKRSLFLTNALNANSMTYGQDYESVEVKELESKVREAIEKLPPKCKTIYILSRQEGLSYKQIAEHLNLSQKTVENQMGIALEKLRNSLKPYLTREFLAIALLIMLSWLLRELIF